MLKTECKQELTGHIIPFWKNLHDSEFGGYYGFVDKDLKLDKQADKGVILHSRILWFFSKCYMVLGDRECLEEAYHAYRFIKQYAIDYEQGGVYWMLNYKGEPVDTMKHTYNIAFCIYALSAYSKATGDEEAVGLAEKLFDDIEEKTVDEYGYKECFSRDWKIIPNEALSENGLMADKTMNTLLHLIEAYTELYSVTKSDDVAERLKYQLSIMKDKVFDPDRNALRVFFNEKMEEIGDVHSYGHDIEASWLVDRACEVLGDEDIIAEFKEIDLRIADNILNIAVENGGLANESDHKIVDKTRIWWVQAEAIVGFITAFKNSEDTKFFDAAKNVWEVIKNQVIDKREGGEWLWETDMQGNVPGTREIAGPWKCPYHNGRMCLEVITAF